MSSPSEIAVNQESFVQEPESNEGKAKSRNPSLVHSACSDEYRLRSNEEHGRNSFHEEYLDKTEFPIRLEFDNIQFSVPEKKGGGRKRILKGISGVAEPGQFLAIIGASGAGKTSLLNTLASRLFSDGHNEVTGRVTVNGRHISAGGVFQQFTAYVMQDDVLFQTLTGQEAMTFSARLRLPATMNAELKHDRVQNVIEALVLRRVKDTFIGGSMVQGLSGGERKRVSIGVELVTNPGLLLLDEPTSGLDSFTAERIVCLLASLANSGRTVVSTIHQPNSDLWNMFDQVCLMADGHVVYLGPREDAVEYFTNLGFQCPNFTNPADYLLKITTVDHESDFKRLQFFVDAFRKHVTNLEKDSDASKLEAQEDESLPAPEIESVPTVGWCTEIALLTHRTFLNVTRLPLTSRIRLFQALFFGVIMGIIFFDLDTDPRGIQDRLGAMFFMIINVTFGTASPVILTFPVEKRIFQREHANRMYSTLSYFLSKVIVEMPFNLIFILVTTSIAYPMLNLTPGADKFFEFVLICFGTSLFAYGLGLFVGAMAASPEAAAALLPVSIIPFMMFAGFFVNVDSMPVWISWMAYVSFMRYGFEAAVVSQFDDDFQVKGCQNPSSDCSFSNGKELKDFYGYGNINLWVHIIIVYSFAIGMMFLTFLVLYRRTRRATVHGTLNNPKSKNE
eukprot:619668_1